MSYLTLWNNRRSDATWPLFAGLDEQLDSLFAGFPSAFDFDSDSDAFRGATSARWYENDDAYQLRVDLPGLKAKDIELEWRDGALSISAKRVFDRNDKNGKAHATQSFNRSFEVPDDVNADKVKASYEDGVLSLTMPKSEKAKPRRIEVRGAR